MPKRTTRYVLYIILCRGSTLYTGITTDLARRFAEHKSGKGAKYTRAHPPIRVLHHETYPSRSRALIREAAIKRLSRKDKLALIRAAKKPAKQITASH